MRIRGTGPLTDPRRVSEYLCSALLFLAATRPESNVPLWGGRRRRRRHRARVLDGRAGTENRSK